MKVLVTGGTGYIGSHTCVELIKSGHTVEILDNLSNSKEESLDKIEKITGTRPKFHKVDLKDYEKTLEVFESENFEAVIHFAGLKAVGESVEKPLEYYENNVGGAINLLRAMRETGVKKLIFSSSATVYGDQGAKAYSEEMTTGVGITNPYGWTKSMIEQIIRDFSRAQKDFSATILRYFNPIGADKSGFLGEDPNGIPNNLMPVVMKVYRGEIPELTIFGDDYETEDGSCRRDFIHVTDLAKGHIAALENMENGTKVYNLGSGKPTSVFEVISLFEKISGEKLPVRIGKRRAGDLSEFWANPELAKKELGWETELDVEDAIRDTLNYLKNLS
ncbi:UDP-glucose 4-epimerase GalE [Candidatus Saccharibacteria bacterium]|nr:UDP-glucose 4-epimerase GalE [Candidatus Saccharibacteria bacterium]